jgi:predicted kinase
VVDASFSERAFRAPFVDAAARLELPYCLVLVEASEEETRARLARARGARTGSDADLAVYLQARERFEPPDELPGGHVLRIASGRGTPEDAFALLLDRLIALERSP